MTMSRWHDYRRQGWGHACDLRRTDEVTDEGSPVYKGHCFASIMSAGDGLLLHMRPEKDAPMGAVRDAAFKVITVRWPGNPPDFYFIEAVPMDKEAS